MENASANAVPTVAENTENTKQVFVLSRYDSEYDEIRNKFFGSFEKAQEMMNEEYEEYLEEHDIEDPDEEGITVREDYIHVGKDVTMVWQIDEVLPEDVTEELLERAAE